MDYFPVILLFFLILLIIVRLFTVLFHELGHAIPAILMTRKPVSIYIGSYGNPKKSVNFRIGLLDVWFKYNPLSWRLGLCVLSEKTLSINKQIVYTLAGPLTSFVIAIIACYFTFAYDLHGFLKLIFVFFLGSSIVDLFINFTPKTKPIKLYNGKLIYNDGYRLKQLLYYKKYPKDYEQAVKLYNEQKFGESAVAFDNILKNGLKNENIYRLAISSFMQAKNYVGMKELVDLFFQNGELNSDDFANAGLVYSHFGEHEKAIGFYDKSLALNPENRYSLNNKGFTLNLLGKFEEAIPLFDRAIEVDQEFVHAYCNRGLAKIKIGQIVQGLEEINYSLQLDDNNSYAYRNLGIYHLDKGEKLKALDLFKRAKELDVTAYMIDALIDRAENKE